MATPKKPAPKVISPVVKAMTATPLKRPASLDAKTQPIEKAPVGVTPSPTKASGNRKAGNPGTGPTPAASAVEHANPNARFKRGPRQKRPVIKEPARSGSLPDLLWHHW